MSREELYMVKLGAILHDVGKPSCWASKEEAWKHPYHTSRLVLKALENEEVAEAAKRHHSGPSYPKDLRPESEVQRIIDVADDIASGADRPGGDLPRRIALPIKMLHPLSEDIVIEEMDSPKLLEIENELARILSNVAKVAGEDLESMYKLTYEEFSRSKLRIIPAFTQEPNNDHSLWAHLKLTAAFAACIYLEGYKGARPDDYEFCLISGDVDSVGAYINRSRRLCDLRAGSRIVDHAIKAATKALEEVLGPECIIFKGGGNFLALSPPSIVEKLVDKAEEAFIEAAYKDLSITVTYIKKDGLEFKEFGRIWDEAIRRVRLEKLTKSRPSITPIGLGMTPCDACSIRPAELKDPNPLRYVPYDASPRPELLCKHCFSRRYSDYAEGVEVDGLVDDEGYIAIIKADGDDIGEWLSGRAFNKINKSATPSRISWLSEKLDEICSMLGEVVKVRDLRGEVIFAGGDDMLAIVQGNAGLEKAYELAMRFKKEMVDRATMSAGVTIMKKGFPIYAGLKIADALLRNVKSIDGKFGIDFELLTQVGVTPEDVSMQVRNEMRKKALTHKPYKISELEKIFRLRDLIKKQRVTMKHLHYIVNSILKEGVKLAEAYVKSLMGRGTLNWEDGLLILDYMRDGIVCDAYHLLTTIWGQ